MVEEALNGYLFIFNGLDLSVCLSFFLTFLIISAFFALTQIISGG